MWKRKTELKEIEASIKPKMLVYMLLLHLVVLIKLTEKSCHRDLDILSLRVNEGVFSSANLK